MEPFPEVLAQGRTAIQTTENGVEATDRHIDGAADEPYVVDRVGVQHRVTCLRPRGHSLRETQKKESLSPVTG